MAAILTSKAPGERVDYIWTPPVDAGDTITGAATVIRASGTANLDSATVQADNLTVKLWFTLGADGETSVFAGQVTTTGGRTWQETFYLPVATTALTLLGSQLARVFPAFAAVAPAQMSYWLTRALLTTTGWTDDHATMLLGCHLMAINGLGTDGVAQIAASGMPGVKSLTIGPIKADFSDAAAKQMSSGDYDATSYGQQFKKLLLARSAGGLVSDSGYYSPYNYDSNAYVNIW